MLVRRVTKGLVAAAIAAGTAGCGRLHSTSSAWAVL